MCAARQTRDDMSNAAPLVCDVLHVKRVAAFSVTSTKVCITCSIRSLNAHNKAVDEQHNLIMVHLLSVLQWNGHLWQLIWLRQRNVPTEIHSQTSLTSLNSVHYINHFNKDRPSPNQVASLYSV